MTKSQLKLAMLVLASLLVLFDVNSADAQRRYRGELTSCPRGTVPVPETDNCIPERRGGGYDRRDEERFERQRGRRTERRPDYRDERDRGDYRRVPGRELSTVCRFRSGPRAGTSFDYAAYGMAPIAVGGPCNDGVASQGIVVSNRRQGRR